MLSASHNAMPDNGIKFFRIALSSTTPQAAIIVARVMNAT
ncbi:hypothetical protein SFUMM280S_09123 [Streptomyces fumanus]